MYNRKKIENVSVFGRVGVLYGGASSERNVSLKSGAAVLNALLASGVDSVGIDVGNDPISAIAGSHVDRVFVVLHGEGGEDGKVQAVLDFMGLPYTGSKHAASALAMDKLRTKQVWQARGLPTPAYEILRSEMHWQSVLDELGGAAFVKPIHEGSSIGLSLVNTAKMLEQAFEKAKTFDQEVLVEKKIEGQEYTVAILNGSALPAVRLTFKNAFYDYDAKYISDETEYFCPSGLSEEKENELKALAVDAFRFIGCRGWGRVDVMQDDAGKFYLLEVNTVPGMTDHSLVPMAAKGAGLEFNELVLEILATTLR